MAPSPLDPAAISRRKVISIAGITLLAACGTEADSTTETSASPVVDKPGKSRTAINRLAPRPINEIDEQQAVALTVDDGPDPVWTPRILEVLAKHDVKATYFMVGYKAEKHPDLVRMVKDAGHSIANHSYTHANMAQFEIERVHKDLQRTSEALGTVSGSAPNWFRAPYGAWSDKILSACEDLNLRPLGWSVDPLDWRNPGTSQIVKSVLTNSKAGSVILQHDSGADRIQTAQAIDRFVPELKSRGLTFVTL